ncbi:MAG: NAD(+) synthase [Candidatus Nitrosotenuis sp.]
MKFDANSLIIKDIDEVSEGIQKFIKEQVFNNFKKNGAVIGISGGIDSAVVSALCEKALGPNRVLGVLMPEKESDPNSRIYAEDLCKKIGIKTEIVDLTPILESFHVYETRDQIIKRNFTEFDKSCRYRVVVVNDLMQKDGISIPYLEVADADNFVHKIKLPYQDYLTLTAATNIKHRVRMTILYYHGERNHFLVAGTTNKSEVVQGYFVKYGDGGVDIEPIANLFKTQIFQLARHLDIPEQIIQRKPSPDTWSFTVSDEEFFYGIPYNVIDLLWYAREQNIPKGDIQKVLGLSAEQVDRIFENQSRKWGASKHLREMPPKWDGKIILNK